MTGFVDPAFKNIKVNEPNFLVWRVSKLPEENYDVKPVRREFLGYFYDEDSYIVYRASPVKKVLGCNVKDSSNKMEVHVHFWLGEKLGADDCRRTIIKAVELDEVLEGVSVLHREVQGYESNRFLSYFRDRMVIKLGELATAMKQGREDNVPKLYGLSERASTLILTQLPEASWKYIFANKVNILETKQNFFVWKGTDKNTADQSMVARLEQQIQSSWGNKKVFRVLNGLANESLVDEFYWNLDCFTHRPEQEGSTDDLQLIQTMSRSLVKLYKVVPDGYQSNIILVKNAPLNQSDLYTMDLGLIDHGTNGVWVWVNRRAAEDVRSRAINIGIAYLDNKKTLFDEKTKKLTVTRAIEGSEPEEFKFLFQRWTDAFAKSGQNYFCNRVARPVNASLTADVLDQFRFLAAEMQLLDFGSGKMRIFRVSGRNLEALAPDECGIFHSSFSYLVHYTYVVNEKTTDVLYYWLGSDMSQREKDKSIWPLLSEIPELRNASVLVRVHQSRETPHFYAIFQGKILVLTRHSSEPVEKLHRLDHYPVLLFKVIGGDLCNTLSLEVKPSTSSLDSHSVFILRTPKISYVWSGLKSRGDEREIAKHIVHRWTYNYHSVLEGNEDYYFWSLLENVAEEGAGFQRRNFCGEDIVQPEVNVPPRFFKCSFVERKLRISETVNFTQSDLHPHDTVILDASTVVFVWTGSEVPDDDKYENDRLAMEYLASDPSLRDSRLPIIHVFQGREPPTFTGFFPSWQGPAKKEDKCETAEAKDEKVPEKVERSTAEYVQVFNRIKGCEIPLIHLVNKPEDDVPKVIDPANKERYLNNTEFNQTFGMTREKFYKLPMWHQKKLKKSAGLL